MIKNIQDKHKELGKIPSSREMKNPSHTEYIKQFGSWNKALAEAGSINKSEIETYNKMWKKEK